MNRKAKIGLIIGGMVLAIVIFFVTQTLVQVVGRSMEPTYMNNDIRLVNKAIYWIGNPKRGDIVYYEMRGVPSVGRVVGLPYEVMEFRVGGVWVDGQRINENYLAESVMTTAYPGKERLVTGKEEYIILGDNRGRSADSRRYGSMPRKAIWGKFW